MEKIVEGVVAPLSFLDIAPVLIVADLRRDEGVPIFGNKARDRLPSNLAKLAVSCIRHHATDRSKRLQGCCANG